MENCIFCKIIRGEIPAYKVYEDEENLAFLELNPSAPGHTLIISKKHGYSIMDYDQKELGSLMEATKMAAKKLEEGLGADSLSIGINHKEKTGLPHLHIHIIPRFDDDKGGVMQSIVKNAPKDSPEKILARINLNKAQFI